MNAYATQQFKSRAGSDAHPQAMQFRPDGNRPDQTRRLLDLADKSPRVSQQQVLQKKANSGLGDIAQLAKMLNGRAANAQQIHGGNAGPPVVQRVRLDEVDGGLDLEDKKQELIALRSAELHKELVKESPMAYGQFEPRTIEGIVAENVKADSQKVVDDEKSLTQFVERLNAVKRSDLYTYNIVHEYPRVKTQPNKHFGEAYGFPQLITHNLEPEDYNLGDVQKNVPEMKEGDYSYKQLFGGVQGIKGEKPHDLQKAVTLGTQFPLSGPVFLHPEMNKDAQAFSNHIRAYSEMHTGTGLKRETHKVPPRLLEHNKTKMMLQHNFPANQDMLLPEPNFSGEENIAKAFSPILDVNVPLKATALNDATYKGVFAIFNHKFLPHQKTVFDAQANKSEDQEEAMTFSKMDLSSPPLTQAGTMFNTVYEAAKTFKHRDIGNADFIARNFGIAFDDETTMLRPIAEEKGQENADAPWKPLKRIAKRPGKPSKRLKLSAGFLTKIMGQLRVLNKIKEYRGLHRLRRLSSLERVGQHDRFYEEAMERIVNRLIRERPQKKASKKSGQKSIDEKSAEMQTDAKTF
jgi:hypothetical protein